jgi:hypothetical protein
MEHIKTTVEFKDGDEEWRVEYTPDGWAIVKLNNEMYHIFDAKGANTRTKNPTKTKSLELIKMAKKARKK